jgi:hypothetical protein
VADSLHMHLCIFRRTITKQNTRAIMEPL